MIAADTNLLVRLAAGDDPAAQRAVLALFESERVLIMKTVMLETEWVLRSRFGYTAAQTHRFFAWLADLPMVTLEDEPSVLHALDLLAAGLDFADALHLASAGVHELVTMDRALYRKALKRGQRNVRLLTR